MQGFGNVGGVAACELHERGALVVAVSDVSGGLHDERGLDVPALHAYAAEHGSLAGYDLCERITNEQLLELPCDVLVLAAREDQLTSDNADARAGVAVVEGANGPTTIEADEILRERGIPVVPGHPHERRRRHGLVLRVGAGSRQAVLGPRRDPRASSPTR